jgi:DNA-binding transcriptional ArsR family regulator
MSLPLLSRTRLKVLELLSDKPMTPSELSKLLGKSLPTITRHLAYLEDFRLVKRVGEERGRTRPFVKYALNESVIFIKVMEKDVGIFRLPLDEYVKVQMRIWSIPQKKFHYYVERFIWQIQDLIPNINAIGVYGSVARGDAREDSDIDMLILASDEVARIRKKCEAMVIEKPGDEAKMVMAQALSPIEFEKALRSGSEFAEEVIKSMLPIYDPNGILEKIKRGRHG